MFVQDSQCIQGNPGGWQSFPVPSQWLAGVCWLILGCHRWMGTGWVPLVYVFPRFSGAENRPSLIIFPFLLTWPSLHSLRISYPFPVSLHILFLMHRMSLLLLCDLTSSSFRYRFNLHIFRKTCFQTHSSYHAILILALNQFQSVNTWFISESPCSLRAPWGQARVALFPI